MGNKKRNGNADTAKSEAMRAEGGEVHRTRGVASRTIYKYGKMRVNGNVTFTHFASLDRVKTTARSCCRCGRRSSERECDRLMGGSERERVRWQLSRQQRTHFQVTFRILIISLAAHTHTYTHRPITPLLPFLAITHTPPPRLPLSFCVSQSLAVYFIFTF